MKFRRACGRLPLLLFFFANLRLRAPLAAAASGRQINATASTGNHIHFEEEIDLSSTAHEPKVEVTSDVPVTIQRYNDVGSKQTFLDGQQPVPGNMVKVLVTSSCATTETQVVPAVAVSSTGTIKVTLLGVNEEEVDAMRFLEPSSYSAFWTWVGGLCGSLIGTGPTLPGAEGPGFGLPTPPLAEEKPPGLSSDGCRDGQCLDPDGNCADEVYCFVRPCHNANDCDHGCVDNYCGGCHPQCVPPPVDFEAKPIFDEGPILTPIDGGTGSEAIETQESCDSGLPCDEAGSTCGRGEETCCGETYAIFQCDCVANREGGLEYDYCRALSSCMFPSCCGSGSPEGMPSASPGTCEGPGSLCDTGVKEDYCCEGDEGTYCSKTGGSAVATPIVETPSECECEFPDGVDPATACEAAEYCQQAVGVCGQVGGLSQSGNHCGKCVPTPDFCAEIYDPVCACDGRTTYENECSARLVGASISYKGECGATKPTIPTDPIFIEVPSNKCEIGPAANTAMTCGEKEFCQLDSGVCNDKSGVHVGACTTIGDECIMMLDPVCGCDQKTYSNECSAHSAGVSVSRMGECNAKPTAPTTVVEVGGPAGTTALSCPESLDGIIRPDSSSVLYYEVVPSSPPGANNGLLCARLEVKGGGWVGFGISPDGSMIGSNAIIGASGTVLKYDLTRKATNGVLVMDDDKQTLMDTSIGQADDMTVMEFTKLLVEEGEIPILEEGANNFLFAKGFSDTLTYHSKRMAFMKDFSEDVVVVPPAICDSFETCLEAGSTCTAGSESCCGETYHSISCTCEDNGAMGLVNLQYVCMYTDACLLPSCCQPGPPADEPPPSPGFCNIGERCETGIAEDYCCSDVAGSYCSKSGGPKTETFSTHLATAESVICNPCEGISSGFVQIPNTNCGEYARCADGDIIQKIACSSGLIFDASINQCNWESNVKCGSDPVCPTSETMSTTPADAQKVSQISPAPQLLTTEMPSKSPTGMSSSSPTGSSKEETSKSPTTSSSPTKATTNLIGVSTSSPTGAPNKSVATTMATAATNNTTAMIPIGVSTSSPTGSPNKVVTTTMATTATNNTTAMIPIGVSTSSPTGSPNKVVTTTMTTTATNNTTAMIPIGVSTSSPTGAPNKSVATTMATTATNNTTTMISDGATTSVETDASTTGTTTASTTTIATIFAIDADFPTTLAPSTKPSSSKVPTPSPNDWWQDPGDANVSSPSSAFNHSRSFSFCMSTAFVAIVAISLVFPGLGGKHNLWGFSSCVVAAVAVSSLYSKTPSDYKGGNIRRSNNKSLKPFPAQNERALQTCTFNVEILIDGCNHPLEISAPASRVVDVVIENLLSNQLPDCVTEYEATLNFPVTSGTTVLDLEDGGTASVDPLPEWQCIRAVAGRPFVDATGGSLQATPWIHDDKLSYTTLELSWTGEALVDTQTSPMNNATNRRQVLLGEDWTQRALGEHASIASFSAFSIALMSNGAPAALVEDALKAGLDEIRHARTSFEIASKMTGRDIGPGPLPESKLEFGQDLKALALAVAREGCVDETLSAFAAAVEVKHITEVLANEIQDTPYINVDRDLLASIRDELVTISMDESNHSALAWRTLSWVCSVNLNVCEAVYTDVFSESNLEMRFNQRADSSFSEMSWVLHSMRGEWKKIFNAHQLANSGLKDESLCKDVVQTGEGESLLTSVTKNILRQVSCNKEKGSGEF